MNPHDRSSLAPVSLTQTESYIKYLIQNMERVKLSPFHLEIYPPRQIHILIHISMRTHHKMPQLSMYLHPRGNSVHSKRNVNQYSLHLVPFLWEWNAERLYLNESNGILDTINTFADTA